MDWRPGRVDFFVDDVMINTVKQAPDYPMQLILGVFDFPDRARSDENKRARSGAGRPQRDRPSRVETGRFAQSPAAV